MRPVHGRRAAIASRIGILACTLVAWCSDAFALNPGLDVSQYAHAAWRVRDGFAKGSIYAIAQTPDGYLWLGTDTGLLRFDGVKAIPWQPPPGSRLPSDTIVSLLAGTDGTLWIGTNRGLVSWKDATLVHHIELSGRRIYRLLEDDQHAIWMSTANFATNRFSLCAIQHQRVQCYGDDGGPGVGAIGLYQDRGAHLWVGTLDGVWHWKPGAPTFFPLARQPNGIQGLSEADDGALLISWAGGIHRLVAGKPEPAYLFPAAMQPAEAFHLLRDRDGGLWAGTADSGLVHIHRGITDVFTKSDGLSGDSIVRLFEDREGNIWVVTTEGIDRFRDPAVALFSTKQGLSSSFVQSVLASRDGSVWVGTLDGVNNMHEGITTLYRQGPPRRTVAAVVRGSRQVREITGRGWRGVQSMLEDRRDRLWLSTTAGVGYLERDRFVFVRGIPGLSTRAIVEDNRYVWVVNGNANVFRVSGDAEVRQIPSAALERQDTVTAASADPRQPGVWLGFDNGGIISFSDGRVRSVYGSADGLGRGKVRDLRFDADGTLWAATEGGLSRVKDGRVATLSSKNGLPCDTTQWSLEDDLRSLWISSTCGLVRIARAGIDDWLEAVEKDRNTQPHVAATVFDASDGFVPLVFATSYSAPAIKASDGRLWFVARDGVSVIDPRHLPLNMLPAPVQIEQVTADRANYDPAAVANGAMPLPARTRDLQIDYTALSLAAPEKVRFRYKLENHDGDWQDVGPRRQAFYNDLPPGSYRFRVTASNNSGLWNDTGAFLDFSIAPAYYQTTWFRAASVVTVLALLWTVYQLRLRQVAHAFNLRLDERVGERTRIARELHDTLLQSFQGLMLRFQSARDLLPGHPEMAVEALDGALDRADQAIVEGRDAIQNLRSSTVASNELAQAIATLAEELTHGSTSEKGAAMFHMSVEGSPRDLHPIVRDDVHRIAREALRNAFRHAHADHIEAEVTYGARELRLRIRDDGKGIDPQQLSGGRARHWGLAGMRERAVHIGAHLDLWSQPGAGTELELRIPGAVAYGVPGGRAALLRRLRRKGGGS